MPPIVVTKPVWWPLQLWAAGTVLFALRSVGFRIWLFLAALRRTRVVDSQVLDVVERLRGRVGLRRVRVLLWPGLRSPIAFGTWTPTIALPVEFTSRFDAYHVLARLRLAAPSIQVPPVSQTLVAGLPVSWTVQATGYPLSYQWYHDGVVISGANTPTYSPGLAVDSRAGDYAVVVSNFLGAVTNSIPARLTVLPADGTVVTLDGQQAGGPATVHGVVSVSAGWNHALALKADGSVFAWGDDSDGECDVPESAKRGVVAVAAGASHSLALREDGSVVAWGGNDFGQTLVPVAASSHIKAIAAGSFHSLALTESGEVLGWGDDLVGAVTIPATARSGITAIAAGASHSVALNQDGSVVVWGDYFNNRWPMPVEARFGVVAIAAGDFFTLALKLDGTLLLWGLSAPAGNGLPTPGGSEVVALTVGRSGAVTRDNQGHIRILEGTTWLSHSWANDLQGLVTSVSAGGVVAYAVLGTPVHLAVEKRPDSAVLTWPLALEGVSAQSSLDLADPNGWRDLDGVPARVGVQWRLTNAVTAPQQWFRLRRP